MHRIDDVDFACMGISFLRSLLLMFTDCSCLSSTQFPKSLVMVSSVPVLGNPTDLQCLYIKLSFNTIQSH